MLYAVLRRDRPGMAARRASLQPAHARYQKAFMGAIVFGGGLVAEGTGTARAVDIANVVGNVLIIEVPDRAGAQAFRRDDPYTRNDLFETVIIEPFWQRVPPPQRP